MNPDDLAALTGLRFGRSTAANRPLTRVLFTRWEGGPGGHAVPLGLGLFDRMTGEPVFVPLAVRDYDPRTWNLDDVLTRFRPGRFATAYSDPCEVIT